MNDLPVTISPPSNTCQSFFCVGSRNSMPSSTFQAAPTGFPPYLCHPLADFPSNKSVQPSLFSLLDKVLGFDCAFEVVTKHAIKTNKNNLSMNTNLRLRYTEPLSLHLPAKLRDAVSWEHCPNSQSPLE